MTAPLLAIFSQGPGRQTAAREALDAVLATAVFGTPLQVLFCGAGVLLLVTPQGDYTASDKPLDKQLAALPLYDVDEIYVDSQSLASHGLEAGDLPPAVQVIDGSRVSALLRDCRDTLSF